MASMPSDSRFVDGPHASPTQSSSLSSSIATSLSSSSSSSSCSSRGRFWPLFSDASAFAGAVCGFGGRPDGAGGGAAGADPGTGALKMLCCRSDISTAWEFAVAGSLNVPSSFVMTFDLDFAYITFCKSALD